MITRRILPLLLLAGLMASCSTKSKHSKLFNKNIRAASMFGIFFVGSAILGFFMLLGGPLGDRIYGLPPSSSTDSTSSSGGLPVATQPPPKPQSGYIFSPAFSEFSVTFSAQPTITEIEKRGKTGKRALLLLSKEGAFQRAEAFPLPSGMLSVVSKELAFADLAAVAERDGLQSPEYEWEVTALGPAATMRATKMLTHSGHSFRVTYFARQHYGDHSLMVVGVGCEADKYPIQAIADFLRSVKKTSPR